MKTLGFFIAFFGWLFAFEGYTVGHIAMIIIGLTMFVGGVYLEKR